MKCPVWTVLPLFQSSPREVANMVTAAESLGLTGVLATDHLAGWRKPTGPVLEATTVMGLVGALARGRVGSLVLQTTTRPPSYTALVAETLAGLSRQPPLIGLGVGDSRWKREVKRVGLPAPPLSERIKRLRQTIAAIRSRAPGLEVWVGGWRPELLELAAELADGWNAWGGAVADFETAAAQMKRMNAEVQISWGGLLATDQPLSQLRQTLLNRVEAGAQSLVVALTPPRAETLRRFVPPLLDHPIFHPTAGT